MIIILSPSCSETNYSSATASIHGMYLYLVSSVFLLTFLFWLSMITKFYKRFLNVNWIFTVRNFKWLKLKFIMQLIHYRTVFGVFHFQYCYFSAQFYLQQIFVDFLD